jgi:hypothetical protein
MHMSRSPVGEIAENLILARLLVAGSRPPARIAVQKSLAPLFAQRLSPAEWRGLFAAALDGLIARDLVAAKPLALTSAGRERALEYWQIDHLPAKVRWETVKREFVVPRALGISRPQLAGKDKTRSFVAAVLKNRYRLPAEVGSTATAVVSALAWQQLDIISTARFTPQAVVGQALLKSARPLSAADLAKQLAKLALDTTGNDLFTGAVRRWIAADTERKSDSLLAPGGPPSLDDKLPNFADSISRAARDSQSGRFGDNKVFIAEIWRAFQERDDFDGLSLREFKERLVEAHRRRLLELSRADLVERMDPRDVAESETKYLDATFHFVRVDQRVES